MEPLHTGYIAAYNAHAAGITSPEPVSYALPPKALHKPVQLFFKETIDRTLASIALILALPVLLVVACAIRMETRGPLLFRQRRGGKNGTSFTIFKFRTMTHEACNKQLFDHTKPHDPRMTRVGKFLRKTSLDELPQLLNVLLGDMSLVGPRPHMLDHDDHYRRTVRGYDARFRMKPGLTGLAQVNGRRGMIHTDEDMQARVDDDNTYIDRWSLWKDIVILFKTPFVVIWGKNAH